MSAMVQPLSSETLVRKPLICGLPKTWEYFASARGEAKLTFEVMMVFGGYSAPRLSVQPVARIVFRYSRIAQSRWGGLKKEASSVSSDRDCERGPTMRRGGEGEDIFQDKAHNGGRYEVLDLESFIHFGRPASFPALVSGTIEGCNFPCFTHGATSTYNSQIRIFESH